MKTTPQRLAEGGRARPLPERPVAPTSLYPPPRRQSSGVLIAIIVILVSFLVVAGSVATRLLMDQAALAQEILQVRKERDDLTKDAAAKQADLALFRQAVGTAADATGLALADRLGEIFKEHGPGDTLPSLLERRKQDLAMRDQTITTLKQVNAQLEDRISKATPMSNERVRLLEEALARREKELREERQRQLDEIAKYEETMTALSAKLESRDAEVRAMAKAAEIDKSNAAARINSLEASLRSEKVKANRDLPVAELTPERMKPVGTVVAVDTVARLVTLSGGRSANHEVGMRLRLFRSDDGRPGKEVATVEVARLEERTTRARIVKDELLVPILAGDLAVNPVQSDGRGEWIAVAGKLDLDGAGGDGTEQLLRTIRQQGGTIGFQLDAKGKRAGKLGPKIKCLVMDEVPTPPATPEGQKLHRELMAVYREAIDLGIPVVTARKFLRELGYKTDRRP